MLSGPATAPFVPDQGLWAQGNIFSPHPRTLSTVVLAQTTGKLPKHHACFSKCKITGRFWHRGFYRYLEPAFTSNPRSCEMSATLAPCISGHGQPRRKKETVGIVYILKTYYLRNRTERHVPCSGCQHPPTKWGYPLYKQAMGVLETTLTNGILQGSLSELANKGQIHPSSERVSSKTKCSPLHLSKRGGSSYPLQVKGAQ